MPVVGRKHDYLNATYGANDTSFVTKNAPFGNNDSQLQRIKIVGGQRLYVKEDSNWPEKSKKTVQTLHPCSPIARTWSKQLNSDHTPIVPPPIPQNINSFDLTNYWQQRSKISQSHGDASIPKTTQPQVPETTKASLNPHPVLPPIDDTLDRITAQTASGDAAECLAKYIPSSTYLAPQAITLSKQDELLLKQRISHGLGANFHSQRLKEVYNELVEYDEDLTGYVAYTNIGYALLRSQVHLSVMDLRLLCSMYVSTTDARKVNYEKVLSFIAACFNSTGDRSRRKSVPNDGKHWINSEASLAANRPSLMSVKLSIHDGTDSEDKDTKWEPYLEEVARMAGRNSKDTLISPRNTSRSLKSLKSEPQSMESNKQDTSSETHKDRRTGGKRPDSSPWFDRFMKMAKAFYLVDSCNTGQLPLTNAKWLVEEYNSVYSLAIPRDKIETAVEESIHCEQGKRVVGIDNLLRQLIKHAP